ncbi:tRNA (adenosine(37)-N6)-dimethylallyltransferase MiaA [Lichenihabitans sp. Uapishka_5]|uniref:tRNA (adenosine(37)-N6)-dimethylallyltransferase MiaA n=1 Tax=Lichenihabitans sp. Uapishka_5 TaxID=3037302 RepID=UPI0029E80B7B|nr:tRNA (adenosine(37)-N6)-dimethylallyltransferase MiaA [Lichenihabitans sp. Uapishka_5]MDX7950066.1 tRNA (adenosine(37)-N6)-dimethylallyltransferase MiaA [Lichenihabitans sp. Uapishka_5]
MGGDTIPAKRAILIAGPTASGKSALAVAVAERLGGTVVNADAMQVYRDLRILTARPSEAEMAQVPHRLFGHVDAAEAYSVGRWLADVALLLEEVEQKGRVPVLVGGTGLYLKALTRGLSPMPAVPPDLRDRLRLDAETTPPAALHARLAACDPGMAARLRPTDPQRILRALEVFEATGRSLLSFQAISEPPLLPATYVTGIFLAPTRVASNAAIDRRFDAMMAAGALDEVAALSARRLDPSLPAMRALGVPHLILAHEAAMGLREAVEAAKLATRQYAKRQSTFVRHQLPDLDWVPPEAGFDAVMSRWMRGVAQ